MGFQIGAPARGRVFALVVGINNYKKISPLTGAVADAQDIAGALRRGGVGDVVMLLDREATRAAFTGTVQRFIAQARAGDLVILSFAGHGSQEPSLKPTARNGGMDEVFMLANFEPEGIGTAERILDKEVNAWLSEFEAKGVAVLFVADSCHGGGMTKTVDTRVGDVIYRTVRRVDTAAQAAATPGTYYVRSDQLPRAAAAALAKEDTATDDFKHLTFVGSVDKWLLTPEIRVPGEPTRRGAISYAFARALESVADSNRDGRTTRRELIDHMRQMTADLTERGQLPVFAPLNRLDEVLFTTTAPGAVTNPAVASAKLRIGVINGPLPDLTAIGRTGAAFELVRGNSGVLDAIWDASTGDAISSLGDIISRRVAASQLGGVIDRVAAVRRLAVLARHGQTQLLLTPDRRTYRAQDKANVRIKMEGGRYVVIANITGDGKIQLVYPLQNDDPMLLPASSGVTKSIADIFIKPPFGSDVLVAVSSTRRLRDLEERLIRLQDQQGAKEFMDLLESIPAGSADVSFVSFFSTPE